MIVAVSSASYCFSASLRNDLIRGPFIELTPLKLILRSIFINIVKVSLIWQKCQQPLSQKAAPFGESCHLSFNFDGYNTN